MSQENEETQVVESKTYVDVQFYIDETNFYAVAKDTVGESPVDFVEALIDLSAKCRTAYDSQPQT